ncbi:MAG: hypothetical protein K6F73_09365 [Lachnospiraceae bacterium]|nr:hypothetical protein [Lachnospiraceae bacterium]
MAAHLFPRQVFADDRTISIVKPAGDSVDFTITGCEAGGRYVLYVLDGIAGQEVPDWDDLEEGLKYVDQKTAQDSTLAFSIPSAAATNGTVFIGDGEEGETYLAGYITNYDTVWAADPYGKFYYTDATLSGVMQELYGIYSDKTAAELIALLPKSAYITFQPEGTDGAAAVKVKFGWTLPEGSEGFVVGETNDFDLTATVTVDEEAEGGKTYKAWTVAYPLPQFKATVKGPAKPKPREDVYHRIYVQNGATATLLSAGDPSIPVNSAKNGEEVIVCWDRVGTASENDYTFVRWMISGAAETQSLTVSQTAFTMGDSDVVVKFSEKRNPKDENDDDSAEALPDGFDNTTKVATLKYPKASLTLVRGKTAANAATATLPRGAAYALPAVTYITDNKDIVTVGSDGTFYATGTGTASVTAYCGNKKAVCKVSVICPTETVSIIDENGKGRRSYYNEQYYPYNWRTGNDNTIVIKSGEKIRLKAVIRPYDNTDPKTVTWKVVSWPIPDKNGNVPKDKSGNIVYKNDAKFLTVKDGEITAKTVKEPNSNPVLVSATVKRTVIDPATGKSKTENITSMVMVDVVPIIAETATNKPDNTHTVALKKSTFNMNSDAEAELEINVSSKLRQDSVAENYVIESCESTNPDIVSVKKTTAFVQTDKAGKKGTAKATIKANNPGTAYIIVKTKNRTSGAPNVQRCTVNVTRPATAITAKSGTLEIETRSISQLGNVKHITMRVGSYGTIEADVTPDNTTDIGKLKIAGTAGVTVKNGLIYAQRVTDPTKNKYAKITVSCGPKIVDTVYVTVTK